MHSLQKDIKALQETCGRGMKSRNIKAYCFRKTMWHIQIKAHGKQNKQNTYSFQ